jgi:membrane-associated phospholipid phosphatase
MSLCNPKNIDFTPLGRNPWIRFPKITQCPGWNPACTSRSFFHQTRQCRNWNFAVQSFPSGHTAEAFFVGVYLALYLNANLNAFSDYSTSLGKVLLILSPVLGAALVAMSVAMDYHHHTHDVIWSIPIGVVTALIAYRAHFASLWNYRYNHLRVRWTGIEEGGI